MRTAPLAIIAGFLVLALVLGLLARRGREMSLEQWTVGGRGFGALFVFLLMAGEIYTTFTFLGGSGWAYGRGAPAFYIVCYGTLAYVASYFILPVVWRHAARDRLVSQADFFVTRYGSPALGLVVSLVSVAALLFYLALQLKGLQIIVSETSYGGIGSRAAVWVGTAAVVVYVMVSGVRGSAWTAAIKDVMILVVAVGLGVYLPFHLYGGFRPMFEAIERARPGLLVLPPTGQSASWFVSTVVLTAAGFYMWPHTFASAYTARNEGVLRRNAVILPLYQLVVLFVFFAGFAAVLEVPGLAGADADLSLLRIAKRSLDPWMVGFVGGAGLLTALVPGSMILNAAATLLAKNVAGRAGRLTGGQVAAVARALVPCVALAGIALASTRGDTIVTLLLMGYSMITQLAPAFLAALAGTPRVTAAGAIAGIAAGEAVVVWLTFSGATLSHLLPGWPAAITDLNVGLVALAANAAVMALVSLLPTGLALRPAHPAGR